jgi:hypothetical protein
MMTTTEGPATMMSEADGDGDDDCGGDAIYGDYCGGHRVSPSCGLGCTPTRHPAPSVDIHPPGPWREYWICSFGTGSFLGSLLPCARCLFHRPSYAACGPGRHGQTGAGVVRAWYIKPYGPNRRRRAYERLLMAPSLQCRPSPPPALELALPLPKRRGVSYNVTA